MALWILLQPQVLSNVANLHVTPHLDGVFCSNYELDQAFTNVFFDVHQI